MTLCLILPSIIAVGCTAAHVSQPQPVGSTIEAKAPENMLRSEIRTWIGTPHRMGGMNRRGIDCSGLVVVLYRDLFHMRLPRTTRGLMHTGRPVDRDALTGGDLVFFKPATKFHHVGIYLGRGEFVHTSTSYGVMISRMDDDFWSRCYLTGRRLL